MRVFEVFWKQSFCRSSIFIYYNFLCKFLFDGWYFDFPLYTCDILIFNYDLIPLNFDVTGSENWKQKQKIIIVLKKSVILGWEIFLVKLPNKRLECFIRNWLIHLEWKWGTSFLFGEYGTHFILTLLKICDVRIRKSWLHHSLMQTTYDFCR